MPSNQANNPRVGVAAPEVSVIIVSYNTRDLTLAAIGSVYDQTPSLQMEVLVVDNCSNDGSAAAIQERFPQAAMIALDENIGFARANNLAAQRARGEFLLLLNPDTVVLDRAIERLVAFAKAKPHAGIWGGRTLFPDKRLNPTSCWARQTLWSVFCRASGLTSLFRNNGFFDPESYGSWQRDTDREVDIVTGCCLLIRRQTWEQLGGFDPAFFMYGEEADLCLRAGALGMRPMVTAGSTIIHYGGASERVRADKLVRLLDAKTRLIRRHWSAGLAPVGVWMLSLWPLSRAFALSVLSMVSASKRESAATWWEVWRRRAQWAVDRDAGPNTVPTPAVAGSCAPGLVARAGAEGNQQ